MQDNLHNYFKDRLDNAEIQPSDDVWSNVENQLPVGSPLSNYKYTIPVLALLCIISAAFVLADHAKTQTQQTIAQKNKQEVPAVKNNVTSTTIHADDRILAETPNQKISSQNQISATPPDQHIVNAQQIKKKEAKKEKLHSSPTSNITLYDDGSVEKYSAPSYAFHKIDNSVPSSDAFIVPEGTDKQMEWKSTVQLNDAAAKTNTEQVLYSMLPYKIVYPAEEWQPVLKNKDEKNIRKQHRLKQFSRYNIYRGFHIGVFTGINNNWLTRKYDHIERSGNTIKCKFDLGLSYGISIGYDYTDRWGIQLEWNIASHQGQKYEERSPTGKMDKEIELNYMKFPLMVKYKIMHLNSYKSKPIVLNILVGPQVSVLRKATMEVDGKTVPLKDNFDRLEFGMMSGLDFDFYMTKNLYMTVGGRAGAGFAMKRGNPMSFQFGISTQLNFRKPPKK